MKQKKQKMYESPKVEFIEMETQGILCASMVFQGAVMDFSREIEVVTWG